MCITKNQSIHIKSQLKIYFICYYIETFLPHDNFFDILLIFVFFLQTYRDICSSHILSFYFFFLQISFCIYLLLAFIMSLYHFYNNLLLYLVSRLGFFDNKLNQRIHSFFIYTIKKNIKHPFYQLN